MCVLWRYFLRFSRCVQLLILCSLKRNTFKTVADATCDSDWLWKHTLHWFLLQNIVLCHLITNLPQSQSKTHHNSQSKRVKTCFDWEKKGGIREMNTTKDCKDVKKKIIPIKTPQRENYHCMRVCEEAVPALLESSLNPTSLFTALWPSMLRISSVHRLLFLSETQHETISSTNASNIDVTRGGTRAIALALGTGLILCREFWHGSPFGCKKKIFESP